MILAPLRQRNFGLLWWAGLISLAGNWALSIALPIYVLRLTDSPAAVATVVAATLLGTVLFGSFAGAYVDRWDRRRVVVVVNLLQALALAPLLLVDSRDQVWIVVAVAFAASALSQFFQPAENALLPRLVAPEHLTAANSLNSLNNNIGRLVGPALGGLVAATLGLHGAALLDAASFAIAAGLCALITGRHRAEDADTTSPHLVRELAEGLRAIATSRVVRAIVVVFTIISIGEGMMGTLFAVYVTRALHAGGQEMGWLMSAQAVGGILGSLIAARMARRFRPVPLIATCLTFFGFIDVVLFNYPRWDTTLWPVLLLFVIVGVPVGIAGPAYLTLFQLGTPDRLRGRVYAALGVSMSLAGILGATLAGALGQTVNVMTLLTVQGAGAMVAGLLFPVLAGRGPNSLAEPATTTPAPAPTIEPSPVAPATTLIDTMPGDTLSSTVEVERSVRR